MKMAQSSWRCPEFKNRKQIGDLERKVVLLRQKNEKVVFNFSGCRGGEGVSTIVVNLVDYMTRSTAGKKILLIDANFQRPVLHEALDSQIGRGLADVMNDSSPWSEAVGETRFENVHFLSCGGSYQSLAGNLEQDKLTAVMSEITAMYDFVLLDSSPLLTSADSLAIAAAADVTFLVVQSMSTQREVGNRAKSLLQDNECFVGGVLLNRVKQVIPAWMYKLL